MKHRKTISLTAEDEKFIAAQVEAGVYFNASEVVRAGLRLLEQEQLRVANIRQAINAGDTDYMRGNVTTYTAPGQLAADIKQRFLKRQQDKQR